ncbi:MAG: hypothetical protein FWG65_06220 [Turicibacter sp.]|nr:hypothetical protein [Turicibacter sp.]
MIYKIQYRCCTGFEAPKIHQETLNFKIRLNTKDSVIAKYAKGVNMYRGMKH